MAGEGNIFSNDGNFMERFKKLQKEKQDQVTPGVLASTSSSPATPQTAPLLRKPIVMKMAAVKKEVLPKSNIEKTFPPGSHEALWESDEEEDTKTDHDIPLAKSIGLGAHMTTPATSRLSGDNRQAPMTSSASLPLSSQLAGKKRKRSRWSDAPPTAVSPPDKKGLSEDERAIASAMASFSDVEPLPSHARSMTGQNLTPAQLMQMQEQIEMNKLVARIRAVTQASTSQKRTNTDPNKPQFEYDSDEETEGGTWEHKKRSREMIATYEKAIEMTENGKGRHHIGDFLPPEELDKFLEKVQAIKEGRDPDFSDYKEHKLDESNVGFRMLRNSGWSEGKGLGGEAQGIVDPINKGKTSFDQAGVGAEVPAEIAKDDNAFDTYRKRMMLAYRFRPNPLNNPRRPYY